MTRGEKGDAYIDVYNNYAKTNKQTKTFFKD
jgi:hypothetical protein